MSTVGVKELKDRLTHYLRQTRRGEEVVVTDRGRPVAVLQRLEAAPSSAGLEVRLARLADQGVLTLPRRKPARKVRKIKSAGRSLSKTILEDRR